MTLGWDYVNGRSLNLTSWSSPQDPSTGNFTYALDPRLLPQVLLFKGQDIVFRDGPYDGVRLGGARPLKDYAVFRPNYNVNETHVYATFSNVDNSAAILFRLNPSSGSPELLRWNQGRGEWVNVYSVQKDECTQTNVVVLTDYVTAVRTVFANAQPGSCQKYRKNGTR